MACVTVSGHQAGGARAGLATSGAVAAPANGLPLSLAVYGSYGSAGSTFAYDGENRLIAANVAGGAGAATFVYDGEGRRVEKIGGSGAVTTTYVHDASGLLAAEYGTAPEAGAGTEYLSADQLGSTRLVVDASGTPQRCVNYLPFGEEIAAGQDGRSGCYETLGSPEYPTSPT